jgi:hypothetical protein
LGTIYVSRSKTLSLWGYDVGLSKHIYKVGYSEMPVKDLVAQGWAGDTDWVLVKKQDDVVGTSEDEIIGRIAMKVKLVEPRLYPRIRDTPGIFKVVPGQVENHLLITRALAGQPEIRDIKIKHPDIADYLIANGLSATGSLT